MGVYSKYKNVNTVFGGTSGIVVPGGSTAERSSAVTVGTVRYNTDLGLIEQYNAIGWQSVDAPPTISTFTGVINENTTTTITVVGNNFKSGATVVITGAATSGTDRSLSTTYVSSSTLTASTNATSVNFVGGASYGIKVNNPSGLSATLDPAGTVDRDPLWTTAAGTTTVFDSGRATGVTYSANDPDGNAITYSLQSGSLPAGASLNASTGAVTGFSAVGSDTTSTFTLRATSTSSTGSLVSTADRTFSILVKAPVVTTYTSVGSTTFTSPVTGNIQVLVVAGGGAGGGGTAGGGGAGGLIFNSSFPVTSGTPYPVTVGGGGPMPTGQNTGVGSNGGNSVFGSITATGGGGGSGFPPGASGQNGGSGGGAGQYPGWGGPFGHGTGSPGQGNPGGQYSGGPTGGSHGGGGGGGAGGTGENGPLGRGGVGLAYSITGSSVTYAGGGMGASNVDTTKANNAGGGGRGGPGGQQNGSPYPGSARGGESGASNTGGGGGGGWDYGSGGAGQGGSGIVVIRY